MRNSVLGSMAIGLLLVLLGSVSAAEKSHWVEFYSKVTVGGVTIDPGKYRMKLGEGTAEFTRNGKVLAKCPVEIQDLGGALPETVSVASDGTLKEVRLKKNKVVVALADSQGSE